MAKRDRKCRANGEGYLERKPNGVYIVRWMIDGVRYSKSTGETTLVEAEKKRKQIMLEVQIKLQNAKLQKELLQAQLAAGEKTLEEIREEKKRVAFSDILETYYRHGNSMGVSEKTKSNYEAIFNILDKWVKNNAKNVKYINDFTADHATDFLAELRSKMGSAGYNSYLKLFKTVWKNLEYEGMVKENVWHKKKLMPVEPCRRRALTLEELKRVLDVAGGYDGQIRLLILLAVYTTLREGDLAYLRWSELDLIAGTVSKVPHKTRKTGKVMTAVLHPVALGALIEWKAKQTADGTISEFVMPYINYKYEHKSLQNKIFEIFHKCGIKTGERDERGHYKSLVCFHSFRHTGISMMANGVGGNRMPLLMLQSIAGHGPATSKITQRYYHADISDMAQYINALPDITRNITPIDYVDVKIRKDVFDNMIKRINNGDISEYIEKLMKYDDQVIDVVGDENVDALIVR